jgi:hypothetical protein
MSYEKTIVCLANSRKQYPNKCVAGKEFRRGNFGAWVRFISDQAKGDLTLNHRRYDDGSTPKTQWVVRTPLTA